MRNEPGKTGEREAALGEGSGAGETQPWGLMALAVMLVGLAAVALLALQHRAIPAFVLVHAVHALVYGAAVWMVVRAQGLAPQPLPACGRRVPGLLFLILAAAVLMRLIAVAAPPALTSDAYRYVWDGRVQAAGINPYLHIPTAPELAALRDTTIYPNINRADTHPTIYPPVAEMLFFVGTRLIDGIRGLQILMLIIDLVTIWAICRWLAACGRPRSWVLIYAWHPLPLWEFAGMAHVDGAGVMFLSLALLAGQAGRQGLAGAAFALAGLVKYHYVLLLPAVWRRCGWRLPLVLALVALACVAPYVSAGPRPLGSLLAHLNEEGYSDGHGFYLLSLFIHFGLPHPSAMAYAVIAALILLGLSVVIAWQRTTDVIAPEHLLWLIAAFLFLVSPHYPWYYALVLPVLCRQFSWPMLWVTLAISGLYLEAPDGLLEPYTRFKVLTITFGGCAVLALAAWLWRARMAKPALT